VGVVTSDQLASLRKDESSKRYMLPKSAPARSEVHMTHRSRQNLSLGLVDKIHSL
jgi:hypothetical protein